MTLINSHIETIDKAICKNIEILSGDDRGLLSQNILSQLRHFVEHIALKIFEDSKNLELEVNYQNIKDSIKYINSKRNFKFLSRFHKLLQISASHYTLSEEGAERLFLKYYEYLLKIRLFLEEKYNFKVLRNLEKFPFHMDTSHTEFYERISRLINHPKQGEIKSNYKDRYYIQKTKPFFVNGEIFYEVTFRRANDYSSKFDRIIAFTKIEILSNYAVKLSINIQQIEVLGQVIQIQIIDDWEVSIRPCELDNFAKIFKIKSKISNGRDSYYLMQYLTRTGLNLIEVIDFEDEYYDNLKRNINSKAKVSNIFRLLDSCRELSKERAPGYNVIRYLLLRLNNKIIKKQYDHLTCELLSNLNLKLGCIPFDQMPFNSSLINHNPKLIDLFLSIDSNNRRHEILARRLKNNTEQKGQLYTSLDEIEDVENIENEIKRWNNGLYKSHKNRRIEVFNNHGYIKEYETNSLRIIEKLKEISSEGIKNYKNSIDSWLESSSYNVDCDEKRKALRKLFEKSKVSLIYGAAGTGKSTMINHISNFFNKDRKLYLANTNPAVDNLKRNIKVTNCSFKTIAKFNRSHDVETDILIIDECSTVSNSDMLKILNRAKFRLLILVGDIFQIESILFGNWFNIIKYFIPKTSVFELQKPYRSNNENLLRLWQRVRELDDSILETLTRNNYSSSLDNSIFNNTENDEIILCLNYDGLYGINNINSILQSSNHNTPFIWGTHTYKVNDPIIFNESGRFTPLIYNNLKGRISGIALVNNKIQFDIEVFLVLNEFETDGYDFELLENSKIGNSVIRFTVDKFKSTDSDDDDFRSVIPFQVAYAVSIHKAQGLEYNSVKVVITDEVEEMISHNVFYTAITRAKEKLKIYWSPESEKKILGSFNSKFNRKDYSLLKEKYNL